MSTDELPEHIRLPHLRPIQPIPVMKDGNTLVALRDPVTVGKETMIVPPQVLQIVQLFRGDRSLESIAEQVNADLEQLAELARGLDRVGLLWGPTFEEMELALKEKIATEGAFEPRASVSVGKDEAACREAIERAFSETEDPELEGQVIGLVAPHLDFQRGWPNYAAAYYGMMDQEPPDRVVILGTNHFGLGDGVVLTEYGFETPIGRCPADNALVGELVSALGRAAIIDQLDHLPEHSIELQVPWIQYCFGNVPIVAALIPDPTMEMISDDDARVDMDAFVGAMREATGHVGGRTFFVASSDLSHVGPQFGEPRQVDDQRRFDVERHDRDMLGKYLAGESDDFLAAMRWNRNPTRWCSIGNMTALLQIVQPETIELIDYRQACDEKGQALVSSAAIALL